MAIRATKATRAARAMRAGRRATVRMAVGGFLVGIVGLLAGVGSAPAWAQASGQASGQSSGLDATCTVSALNRSSQVQPDGSWVLPNIPANVGQVRVRATCVAEDGTVRGGQSDFVTVPANGVVQVPVISFETAAPEPATLALSAPVTTLSTAGETVQLVATATMADASTSDVTPAAAGTSYRSSNPAIASVDAGGLVTAATSGTVLVSALNEGALAVLLIQVNLSGDSDGDGLPDDYELAHGFDPNDPADALGDPDGDGLTTLAEFGLGTDPRVDDSDGDGLLDGDEVNTAGTDPLLFDTDGDLVSDGLEIQAGSDPLDAASVDLAPILASLEATPASFTLTFNTIFGEASRLVQVTATLVDGTELDATGPPYGTTYTTSDPTVASFGTEAGRIFAGAAGSATVTAENGAFSSPVQVTVETFSPTALSYLLIPGSANAVAVSAGHAYVAAGAAGLQVVDTSNLLAPAIVGTADTPGTARDVAVEGATALVADGESGLAVIDVTDPASPAVVSQLATPGDATGLAVAGSQAVIASRKTVSDAANLSVVDFSDPAAPQLVGTLELPGAPQSVALRGDLALIAAGTAGLLTVDLSDPAAPVLLGAAPTRTTSDSRAASVAVRGNRAFVADGSDVVLGGLRSLDVEDPTAPVLLSSSTDLFGLADVALEGGLAFAADYYFVNAVPIFAVDGDQIAFQGLLDFSQAPSFRDDNGRGIAVADGVVYLAANRVLRGDGANGNSALHIGRYAKLDEDTGGQAPTVSITSPAAGTEIEERTFVTVDVAASDDIRVDAVDLTLDGASVGTQYTPPYTFRFRVPAGPMVTLQATARDGAGNESSTELTLPVLANSAPVAEILTPLDGQEVPTNQPVLVAVDATDDQAVTRVDLSVNGSVVDSLTQAPYRFELYSPTSGSPFALSAVAYDDLGPSPVAGPVTLNVVPDQPPTVTLLDPPDGAEVVAGSQLAVLAGATDDVGIDRVDFYADGNYVRSAVNPPPYRIYLPAPAAGASLRLQAIARDTDFHQTSSAEVTVTGIADPLTEVEGRVLDDDGMPLAGLGVDCQGYSATTGTDGRFSISGFPTAAGAVHCAADFTTPTGELRHVVSAARLPVPGGVTDVGDLAPSRLLLYGGFGRGSFSNPGAVALFSDSTAEGELLGDGASPAGLSGLAFDGSGRLLGTTLDGPQGGRTSTLVELDPDTGEILSTIGSITDGPGGSPMAIGDLAIDPVSGDVYGLRSQADGAGAAGKIYRIDPSTGVADLVGDTGTGDAGGLAFGQDGTLFMTSYDSVAGESVLLRLSPTDAAPLSQVALPDFFDGLAVRPSDGLLFATLGGTSGIYSLDPLSGAEVEVGFSDLGQASDLAFRPPLAASAETTVVGRVFDQDGAPIEGARVTVLGIFAALSGADGRFTVSHVPTVFGDLVAVVPPSALSSQRSESAPATPVAQGTTDVGDIVVVSGVSFIETAPPPSGQ